VRIRADAMSHLKIKLSILVVILGLPFLSPAKTTQPPPLVPGPNDGNIAYITARLLEEFHYSQHPFDTEISKRFFDGYLDSFDPQHLFFLQSDIDEFSHYRTNLDVLTLGSHGEADVRPAFEIFARFMERLRQRAAYSDDLLKRDDFNFNSDEQVVMIRKDAPWPKNLDEAKRLWREHLMYAFLQEKMNDETSPNSALSSTNLADITKTISSRYERELRAIGEWDSTDVMQAYLDSLARAYDPHSDYMNPEHAQDFSINMSLSLGGIGAELKWDDGYCEIENLVPGGPAIKSKQLKPEDKIVAVAQGTNAFVDVVDMELGRIVQLIRGPKGTQVRLTIIPVDDPKSRRVVSLVRDEINLSDARAKASLIETPDGFGGTNRIGVIDVPSFYAPTPYSGNAASATNYVSVDVAELVQKLVREKAGGIILDLRGNPGGSLEEAKEFVGLFVTNGPVVRVRAPDGRIEDDGNDDAPDLYQGPLVVLVNRFSASASEIAAAALQDYGRALIIGDTSTFGKGTVQNLTDLAPLVWPASATATNAPGEAKITIRKFYRINGSSTQLRGVVPDIVLPDVWSYSQDVGEDSLPDAMPWDTVSAADYTTVNDVRPYLTSLKKISDEQVATNQDFQYVRQEIAEVEKVQSQKTETLNERKAWDEKQQQDAERNARQKEIDARKLPNSTVYEITVDDTFKPGLPAPIQWETAAESTNTMTVTLDTNALNGFAAHSSTVSATVSTNAVSDNEPVKRVWEPDPMLDESERILQDYISLWSPDRNDLASHE
jgi:carboxyl-terminal processing protease